MSRIVLKNLSKHFGRVQAVKELDLVIDEGDFLTLLGPSGCGKTTTLRCISGLEEPDAGEIHIGDRCIFSLDRKINIPPGHRGLGLVFQNYALWPHMKVGQNIAFGLRKARLQKKLLEEKTADILKTVGLEGYGSRYPHELSGGQQQRVAVARMIVTEPKIFLFDEPLSNLDAKLRMKLRSELKRLHLDLRATTVYVTHDQVEALALSDRIVVMDEGVIQQVGSPYEVYHFPANLFVADFMGNPQTNILQGRVNTGDGSKFITLDECPALRIPVEDQPKLDPTMKVIVNIRPEDMNIVHEPGPQDLHCRVYTTQPMGSEVLVHLKSKKTDVDLMVKNPEEQCLGLTPEMIVTVNPKRGNIFAADSKELICSFGF